MWGESSSQSRVFTPNGRLCRVDGVTTHQAEPCGESHPQADLSADFFLRSAVCVTKRVTTVIDDPRVGRASHARALPGRDPAGFSGNSTRARAVRPGLPAIIQTA